MAIVPTVAPFPLPTNLAPVPRLLAYLQTLSLEPCLDRPKRGIPTLVLALVWLVLAWRASGRPEHLAQLDEPFLATLLGRDRLPCARTLRRGLAYFPAKAVRASVERAYLAELPQRAGRTWAAIDAHQIPYWGRRQTDRFQHGWSGLHSRRLRGYRLYLAIDTDTGQVITFLLARGRRQDASLLAVLARHLRRLLGRRLAGVVADCGFTSRAAVATLLANGVPFILGFARSAPIKARLAALSPQQRAALRDGGAIHLGACPWDARLRLFAIGARSATDKRGPWVYVTTLRSVGPRRLAALYRQRWRTEQVREELVNGHDLNHLVSYRLHPNRVAIGLRLLARNVAIGLQVHDAHGRPAVIREPRAFRATQVDGLGLYAITTDAVLVHPLQPTAPDSWRLPWTHCTVRQAA